MDEEKENLFSNYNPERIEEKWLDTIISENNIDGTDFYSIAIPPPCLLYTSPSPRDISGSRMPSSA